MGVLEWPAVKGMALVAGVCLVSEKKPNVMSSVPSLEDKWLALLILFVVLALVLGQEKEHIAV